MLFCKDDLQKFFAVSAILVRFVISLVENMASVLAGPHYHALYSDFFLPVRPIDDCLYTSPLWLTHGSMATFRR